MAENWAADVKKYVPDADETIIAGIVRYCGIALQKRDSSLVSFSDPKELARVRNNFLKKKLGLDLADDALDAAIAKVGEQMKADRTKNRVTVYYLLAENFGQLSLFQKKAATKKADSAKATASKKEAAPAKASVKKSATAVAATAGVASLASVGKSAKKAASAVVETAGDAVSGAGKAGAGAVGAVAAGVAGVAGKVVDTAGAAASGAADKVGNAASAAGDVVGEVAETAGKVGAAAIGAAGAAIAGAAGLAASAGSAASSAASGAVHGIVGDKSESTFPRWLLWLIGLLVVAWLIWHFFLRHPADTSDSAPAAGASAEASAPAVVTASGSAIELAAAPTEGSVAIPDGEGVTTEMRDGKPVVKVYFASGQKTVPAQLGPTATGLKAYLEGHTGVYLGVSGFADSTGNAAANATVSKSRAEAVKAALIAAGVNEAAVSLVKPANVDAGDGAAARRVEITVR